MAIRQINLAHSIEKLGELLSSYIREDPENLEDGMFYDVVAVTQTISGTEYTGYRARAYLNDSAVPVVDFFLLNDGTLYVNVYYNNGASYQTRQLKWSSTYQYNKLAYAYCTDNGILINYQYTSDNPPKFGTVMITKGSDGYPFVILGSYTNNSYDVLGYHTIPLICHVPDTSYLTPALLAITSPEQTAMCPFMGYGDQISVTYAPYGYWIPQAPASVRNAGFSVMKFNQEIDGISNGYWTIFDGTREEESN